ncbi:MAG: LLM class F420-dependent oxidoreductase [Candidatus Rokubacteria bacterium]|nr:LLM class F420-dependent oxidoreductase [Candidatus Rokubacteria bacterium]
MRSGTSGPRPRGSAQFGFALSGRGPLARPELLGRLAEHGDRLGYDSLFVTDHVVIPLATSSTYPYSATGRVGSDWAQGYLEPLMMLPYLARATKRIRLGTSVLVIPYRNPVLTAKMLATLDLLSGGRVILGAGVGWLREEFEALDAAPYEARGKVTDEYIRLMRECWTREPVEFTGSYYTLGRVSALPKPIQPGGIPVWIGGHTDVACRRAGEIGDGWHPIGLREPVALLPAEYAEKAAIVHQWAQKAGRDPSAIVLSLRAPLELLPRSARARGGDRLPFRGSAPEVIADVRAYQAVGVSHFVFDLTGPDLRAQLGLLDRFAADVRPALARPGAVERPSPRAAARSPRRRR